MKIKLVFEGWRQNGVSESIYSTPLGLELSMGDMHSGTTFDAEIVLDSDTAEDIFKAWVKHSAYPVFRMIEPEMVEKQCGKTPVLEFVMDRIEANCQECPLCTHATRSGGIPEWTCWLTNEDVSSASLTGKRHDTCPGGEYNE